MKVLFHKAQFPNGHNCCKSTVNFREKVLAIKWKCVEKLCCDKLTTVPYTRDRVIQFILDDPCDKYKLINSGNSMETQLKRAINQRYI